MTEPMRIIRLEAENVKRLQAVEIIPDGDVVVIAGRNGQGKTSVLDSIWYALGGGHASRSTDRPVRDGEDEAHVTLDLGDLVVTRTWKGGKTSLVVESGDGTQRFRSPQSMLDSLVGRLSFDPLTFAHQDPKGQLATLLDLVDLPFDPEVLEHDRTSVFDQRTEVNRQVSSLKARLEAMDPPGDDVPEEELESRELVEELRSRNETIREHQRVRAECQEAIRDRAAAESTVEELERQLENARITMGQMETRAVELTLRAEPLLDPETEDVERQIMDLEERNQAIRGAREFRSLRDELTAHQDQSRELTERLESIRDQKEEGVAGASMPISGLGFDETGVTYQGHPFRDCSGAERLRVSVAMAMAMNPTVRVIRITDGSLLDSENLSLIREMAGERGFQVWIERVDETGEVGVVIEDGLVRTPEEEG